YWIDPQPISGQQKQPESLEGSLQALKKEDFSHWFYQPVWKQSVSTRTFAVREATQVWLLFQDDSFLGKELQVQLQGYGQKVINVHSGALFQQNTPQDYTLHPAHADEYVSLFQSLQEQGQLPDQIVHLWNMPVVPESSIAKEEIQLLLERGFFSVIRIMHAIATLPITNCQLSILTTQGQNVLGNEILQPVKALATGP